SPYGGWPGRGGMRGRNYKRKPAIHRVLSRFSVFLVGLICARRYPGPLLERTAERTRFSKSQLSGDVVHAQALEVQLFDGDIATDVVAQFRKTGALVAQMAAQCL